MSSEVGDRGSDGQAVSRWKTLILSMKCLLSIIGLLKLTAALEEVGYEDCIRIHILSNQY